MMRHAAVPPTPAAYATAASVGAVMEVWRHVRPALVRLARRLTPDPDLEDDMVQEALIKLWEIDPTRFHLDQPQEMRYLRRMLSNRMLKVWGREVGRAVAN